MEKSTIHQPADKLFKQAMSDIRVAKEFFMRHLPLTLQTKINLETLHFHKESFIDESFKAFAADVVYSVKFKEQIGYLYTLVEHQSTNDPLLPLRIVKYCIKLLDLHAKQNQPLPLPPIFPLIIYNGSTSYTSRKDFFSLFGENSELMKNIFLNPLVVIDVKQISDETLQKHIWSGVMEFVLKHQHHRNFLEVADIFFQWMQTLERKQGSDYASLLIYYIISQSEGKNIKDLLRLANNHLSPILRSKTMTFAQQLREEGFQKGQEQGREQGREQGKKQGLHQGKCFVLVRLLQLKFPYFSAAHLARVNQANEAQVSQWIDRVIEANSLEEIFGEM